MLLPSALVLLSDNVLGGLGLLLLAAVAGLALPVGAIWLGARTRRSSGLGHAGWLLGWLALIVVVLAGVFLYTLAPAYYRL